MQIATEAEIAVYTATEAEIAVHTATEAEIAVHTATEAVRRELVLHMKGFMRREEQCFNERSRRAIFNAKRGGCTFYI